MEVARTVLIAGNIGSSGQESQAETRGREQGEFPASPTWDLSLQEGATQQSSGLAEMLDGHAHQRSRGTL